MSLLNVGGTILKKPAYPCEEKPLVFTTSALAFRLATPSVSRLSRQRFIVSHLGSHDGLGSAPVDVGPDLGDRGTGLAANQQ